MINKIHNENCIDTMQRMKNDFIDLTVTSPPYDNLREYEGISFDFEEFKIIASELFRVTKPGGVVVWVVSDETVKGSETCTSFKQALYFKEKGFYIHDTMIWCKTSVPINANRYEPGFEYMFILSKGKIKTFNGIRDKINKIFGKKNYGKGQRQKDGSIKGKTRIDFCKKYGLRTNVWFISNCYERLGHPAQFPEKLANDHILSWSNPNDIVYDPFGGAGTTIKMAYINNRQWIMSEISKKYCDITKKRFKSIAHQMSFETIELCV